MSQPNDECPNNHPYYQQAAPGSYYQLSAPDAYYQQPVLDLPYGVPQASGMRQPQGANIEYCPYQAYEQTSESYYPSSPPEIYVSGPSRPPATSTPHQIGHQIYSQTSDNFQQYCPEQDLDSYHEESDFGVCPPPASDHTLSDFNTTEVDSDNQVMTDYNSPGCPDASPGMDTEGEETSSQIQESVAQLYGKFPCVFRPQNEAVKKDEGAVSPCCPMEGTPSFLYNDLKEEQDTSGCCDQLNECAGQPKTTRSMSSMTRMIMEEPIEEFRIRIRKAFGLDINKPACSTRRSAIAQNQCPSPKSGANQPCPVGNSTNSSTSPPEASICDNCSMGAMAEPGICACAMACFQKCITKNKAADIPGPCSQIMGKYPNITRDELHSIFKEEDVCKALTGDRIPGTPRIPLFSCLVLDTYYPGAIVDAVNGNIDFNQLAFQGTFHSCEVPKQIDPENIPITLLEAFELRIKYEKELRENLEKRREYCLSEQKRQLIDQKKKKKAEEKLRTIEITANATSEGLRLCSEEECESDDLNSVCAGNEVLPPISMDPPRWLHRDELKLASTADIDLTANIRDLPPTPLTEAIDCLLKAERMNLYDKYVEVAEDAIRSTNIDKEKEAIRRTCNFQIDMDKHSVKPKGYSYRPIEIVSYIGTTKPSSQE